MENSINSSQVDVKPGMTTFWKVFVAIVVSIIVVGGGTYYLVSMQVKAQKDDLNSQITALQKQVTDLKKTDSTVATVDTSAVDTKTKDWATYADDTYNLSFKYPKNEETNYSVVTATQNNNPDDQPLGPGFIHTGLGMFDQANGQIKYSGGSVFKISATSGTKWEQGVNDLKTIYTNKSVIGTQIPDLHFVNARMSAHSDSVYIESADGSFRGIYFYANIAQIQSIALYSVVYMTNGEDIIIFTFSGNSDKTDFYPDVQNDENRFTEFKTYISGLTDSSTETMVKDFNSTYKYIVLSLKNL